VNFVDPTGEFAFLPQLVQLGQRILTSPVVQRVTLGAQRYWNQLWAMAKSSQGSCPSSYANIVNVTFKHGARHLEGTGLSGQVVENAISQTIQSIAQSASQTGTFWGTVQIEGQIIIYRAYTLASGTINVGTYYPLQEFFGIP
jgi:hypothetical protein